MAELFTGSFIIPGFSQFKPSKEDIDEFVGMVMEKALIVRGSYSTKKIADDPTDDMFLACAMEATPIISSPAIRT